MRILLVEDDPEIGAAIASALEDAGMAADWVRDGNAALASIRSGSFGLVLLDIGLPGADGLTVLRRVRDQRNNVPVIVITARDAVEDRISGLDLGADDYLVKPFLVSELMARVRAVARRHAGAGQPVLSNGTLTIDPATKTTEHNGAEITLTGKEYRLLHTLLLTPGRIFTREELEAQVYTWNEEVSSNAVEVLIHSLRKKTDKTTIKNVRGLGWMVPKA
ncbi:MAG: response regulator transcription factor [Pseudomonadota bacterium]